MKRVMIMLLLCLCVAGMAVAANKPCSQSKGGINHCDGEKYVCNDGSVSASKKVCMAAQWGTNESPKPEKHASGKDKKKEKR